MSALCFIVPGDVVPWARAGRSKNGHSFTPRKVASYKATVALLARVAKRGVAWRMDGVYRLTVLVRRSDWQRMDADRALNTIADALVGELYEDDRHRFLREARIVVGEPDGKPRTVVLVELLDEAEHERDARDCERAMLERGALYSGRARVEAARVANEWREP